MKRRNFLVLSISGVAILGTSYWYFGNFNSAGKRSLAEPDTLSTIWDTETIQNVGFKYRQLNPTEDNRESLLELLGGTTIDDQSAIEQLKEDIISDFRSEQTILIDGWIIALTEARQCALFTLDQTT